MVAECVAVNEKSSRRPLEETVPAPRYTYPILAGLALTFPEEVLREARRGGMLARIGALAPWAVALNEYADLSISAERIRKSGCDQDQFVPLLQTENLLRSELERRGRRLLEDYPDLRNLVEVTENDFILLSKHRDKVGVLEFVELDSGVIEAGYTQATVPGLLKSAGVDFPGEPCRTVDDLRAKYGIYLTDSDDGLEGQNYIRTQRRLRRGIRRLHGIEMLMKIQDDCEGVGVDTLLDIPSYRSYLARDKSLGEEIREIKSKYYGMIGKNALSVLAAKGIILAQHVSGLVKDAKGCNGISPAGDVYYISRLVRDQFGDGCTTLRHQVDESGLLNEVFGRR